MDLGVKGFIRHGAVGADDRRAGLLQLGRELEHQDAAGLEQANELRDVAAAVVGMNVLQHDVRVDEIERAGFEKREVLAVVHQVVALIAVAVVLTRRLDHGGGDIDAPAFLEVQAQALGEAADAAAEIERPPAVEAREKFAHLHQRLGDLVASGVEELVEIPLVFLLRGAGEDGPERIAVAKVVPVPLEFLEHGGAGRRVGFVHRSSPVSSRIPRAASAEHSRRASRGIRPRSDSPTRSARVKALRRVDCSAACAAKAMSDCAYWRGW